MQAKKTTPSKALAEIEKACEEIKKLQPISDEIVSYAKQASYGEVTYTKDESYFGPKVHNTWGKKQRGRVHIDIGSEGYHLMLDRHASLRFIEFIKKVRC